MPVLEPTGRAPTPMAESMASSLDRGTLIGGVGGLSGTRRCRRLKRGAAETEENDEGRP